MKKIILLFSLFTGSFISAAAQAHSPFEHLGKDLSKAGFTLGCLAALASVAERYDLSFGLGALGLGSFLLSPVAEEVYHPTRTFTMRDVHKFRKLIPCGIGGFVASTVGLKALLMVSKKTIGSILE